MAIKQVVRGRRNKNGNSVYFKDIKTGLETIKEYDVSGKLLRSYIKFCTYEEWFSYTGATNVVHHRDAFNNYEWWKIYDKNNNLIHYVNSLDQENEYKYDDKNRMIYTKSSEGLEIWYEYNEQNLLIHYKDSNGYEYWDEFDEDGNVTMHRNTNGLQLWYENDEFGNCISIKEAADKFNNKEELYTIIPRRSLLHTWKKAKKRKY